MKILNPNYTFYPQKRSYSFIKGRARKPFVFIHSLYNNIDYYFNAMQGASEREKTKFFIVSIPRSGTSLLGSFLDSHPDIKWDNEEYRFSAFKPVFLANGMAHSNGDICYGAKLFLTEMNSGDQYVDIYLKHLEAMHSDGWKFVSLIRENSLKHAISYYKFVEGGKGYVLKTDQKEEKNKIVLEFDKLLKIIQWCESFKEVQKKMLDKFPHIEVCYESDLAPAEKRQETMNKVFNFLNVKITDTYTMHKKQSSKYLVDEIQNYDQFLEFVDKYDYTKYL